MHKALAIPRMWALLEVAISYGVYMGLRLGSCAQGIPIKTEVKILRARWTMGRGKRRESSSPITFPIVPHAHFIFFFRSKILWPSGPYCSKGGKVSNEHKTKEELRFTFTPSGRREFVPRDQVFPLFSIYSLLPIHKKYTVLCQF